MWVSKRKIYLKWIFFSGKSSPSSSSVTSKDSGIHPEIPTLPQLPALLETRMNEIQNSTITTTKNILCENDNSTAAEDTEDQVEVIPCITDNDNEESATESCWTPPDSESKFSNKKKSWSLITSTPTYYKLKSTRYMQIIFPYF